MKRFVFLMTSLLAALQNAHGMVVFDPSNYGQNLLSARNSVTQLVNQTNQIQNQIRAIEFQIKNSKHLSNYDYKNLRRLISRLKATSQQGRSLSGSVSELDSKFQKAYPGYKDANIKDYSKAYGGWNQTSLDTLRSSMEEAALVSNEFDKEQQRLDALAIQGKNAQGRMEVLQTLTELDSEMVNQLQELKHLIIAQSKAQTAYLAQKISEEANHERMMSELVMNVDTKFPEYRNNGDLGLIPSME